MTKGSDNEIVLSPKLEELAEEFSKDPESTKFLPLAEEYRRSRMYEEAIYIAEEGLKIHPGLNPAKITLARCYHEVEDRERALLLTEEVLESQPQNVASLRLQGEIHYELGDFDAATQCYNSVLEVNHDDVLSQKRMQEIKKIEAMGPQATVAGRKSGVDISEFEEVPEIELSGSRRTDDETSEPEIPVEKEEIVEEEDVDDLDLELEMTDEVVDMDLSVNDEEVIPEITISGIDEVKEVETKSEKLPAGYGKKEEDPLGIKDESEGSQLADVHTEIPDHQEQDEEDEEEALSTGVYETLPEDEDFIPTIGKNQRDNEEEKGELTREFEDVMFGEEDKLDLSSVRTGARPDFDTKSEEEALLEDTNEDRGDDELEEEDLNLEELKLGELDLAKIQTDIEEKEDVQENKLLVDVADTDGEAEISKGSTVEFQEEETREPILHSESTVELPVIKEESESDEEELIVDEQPSEDDSFMDELKNDDEVGESLRFDSSDINFLSSEDYSDDQEEDDSETEEISVDDTDTEVRDSEDIFAGFSDEDGWGEISDDEEEDQIIVDSEEEIEVGEKDSVEAGAEQLLAKIEDENISEMEITIDGESDIDDTLILKEELKSDGLQDIRDGEEEEELLMVPQYEEIPDEEEENISETGVDTLIRERPEWTKPGEEVVLEEKVAPVTFELEKEADDETNEAPEFVEDTGIFDTEEIFGTDSEKRIGTSLLSEDENEDGDVFAVEEDEAELVDPSSDEEDDEITELDSSQPEDVLDPFEGETPPQEIEELNESPEEEEISEIIFFDEEENDGESDESSETQESTEELVFGAEDVKAEIITGQKEEELNEIEVTEIGAEESEGETLGKQVVLDDDPDSAVEPILIDDVEDEGSPEDVIDEKTDVKETLEYDKTIIIDSVIEDEHPEDDLVMEPVERGTIASDIFEENEGESIFDSVEEDSEESPVEAIIAEETQGIEEEIAQDAQDIEIGVGYGDSFEEESVTSDNEETGQILEDEVAKLKEELITSGISGETEEEMIVETTSETDTVVLGDVSSEEKELEENEDELIFETASIEEDDLVVEDVVLEVESIDEDSVKTEDIIYESDALKDAEDTEEELVLSGTMMASDTVIEKADIFVEYDGLEDSEEDEDELELVKTMIMGDEGSSEYLEDIVFEDVDEYEDDYDDLELEDVYIVERGTEIKDIAAEDISEKEKPSIEEIAASLKEKLAEDKMPPQPQPVEKEDEYVDGDDSLIPLTLTTAKVYEQQGHYEKALDIYRKIVIKDSENLNAREKIKNLESKLGMRKQISNVSGKEKVAILESWLQNIKDFKRMTNLG